MYERAPLSDAPYLRLRRWSTGSCSYYRHLTFFVYSCTVISSPTVWYDRNQRKHWGCSRVRSGRILDLPSTMDGDRGGNNTLTPYARWCAKAELKKGHKERVRLERRQLQKQRRHQKEEIARREEEQSCMLAKKVNQQLKLVGMPVVHSTSLLATKGATCMFAYNTVIRVTHVRCSLRDRPPSPPFLRTPPSRQCGPAMDWSDPHMVLARIGEGGGGRCGEGGRMLMYASQELTSSKAFMLQAVRIWGSALSLADKTLKRDRELVLEAVRHYGWALRDADTALRGDRDVVTEAVCRHGAALEFASAELRGDARVVTAAVTNWGDALQFASAGMRGDVGVATAAVKQHGRALVFVTEALRGNVCVVIAALKQDNRTIVLAAEMLLADRCFVLEAVRVWGGCLEYASEDLRADYEVVLEAVKVCGGICLSGSMALCVAL